jgi:hypothetical protein
MLRIVCRLQQPWRRAASRPVTPPVTATCSNGPTAGRSRTSRSLIDHDDEAREYAYASRSETLDESEEITTTATRRNWTIVSMANDWMAVFA